MEKNNSMWETFYRLSAWVLFGLLLGLGGAAGIWLFFLSGFSFIGLGAGGAAAAMGFALGMRMLSSAMLRLERLAACSGKQRKP
ncbi:MAG: hypothetical protein HFE88_08325 [Acutalibacter sp.]|nr:hypothetical protein [Acutalibacter sp.]MCI8921854.1 hypothetical protein [Acutalibacter sp.]